MALSEPNKLFGIHSATFYQRSSGLPYGIARVLGGSTLNVSGELVKLLGGSNSYPWAAENGAITADLALKVKEIPNFFFDIFFGKTPTEVLADPGNVSALVNVLNTSVQDGVTGIASVGVKSGSEADIKFTKYVVKAVSATTVDVYAYANTDFLRGTDKVYVDDLLKITTAPLTILTAAAATEIPDFGVELIGGSGTIAFVTGDTAEFEANPASDEQTDVIVGEQGVCVPEFGVILAAQKQSDGTMYEFDCFKVKAQGFPLAMEEKAFSEAEITASLLYDSVKNGVFKMRRVTNPGCA